jgi:hypothetical protein
MLTHEAIISCDMRWGRAGDRLRFVVGRMSLTLDLRLVTGMRGLALLAWLSQGVLITLGLLAWAM